MLSYLELNVNPKGRKTGDCSTRALVGVLEIPYEKALLEQAETAIKHCYGLTTKETIDWLLKKYGYVKVKQPRKTNGKKYLVKELDELLTEEQMEEGVIISVANHITCIKHGVIQDVWNCGNKTVGNYWVKEKTKSLKQKYIDAMNKAIEESMKE